MAVERMQTRRQLDQFNSWCAFALTTWFMGLMIGVAQPLIV
jgi:hypothetical protein